LRVVIDIEANALVNPDKIWVIVCKDIDTDEYHIFRKLTEDEDAQRAFKELAAKVGLWIGHNILSYDIPVIANLMGYSIPCDNCIDTLVVSKLADYSRDGHSIEAYGKHYDLEKGDFNDFDSYSEAMETYCIRDVDICHRVYLGLAKYINNKSNAEAIELEQWFEYEVVNALQKNGFAFNVEKAKKLLEKVIKQLEELDKDILDAFPPKEVVVKTFIPKATKYGTISLTSVPKIFRHRISEFELGVEYPIKKIVKFNY